MNVLEHFILSVYKIEDITDEYEKKFGKPSKEKLLKVFLEYDCYGQKDKTELVFRETLMDYENTGVNPKEIENLLHKWTPVEKELPETYTSDRLWISIQYPNGYSRTVEGRYDKFKGEFLYANQKPVKDKVIAWMEYKPPACYSGQ